MELINLNDNVLSVNYEAATLNITLNLIGDTKEYRIHNKPLIESYDPLVDTIYRKVFGL